ncbi:MAG: pfs [Herbinix sp.]|jgi:nucleoside phosphorylase|nr:pfs [Herbinix sp.]
MKNSSIIIITAMKSEYSSVTRIVHNLKVINNKKYLIAYGKIGNNNCHIICSGVGGYRTTACLNNIVREMPPELIINYGSAGSINTKLPTGTIAIPKSVAFIKANNIVRRIDINSILSTDLCDERIIRVNAGTSDKFLHKKSQNNILFHNEAIETIDCETYYLADFCMTNRIPLIVIRCITDALSLVDFYRNKDKVMDQGTYALIKLLNLDVCLLKGRKSKNEL